MLFSLHLKSLGEIICSVELADDSQSCIPSSKFLLDAVGILSHCLAAVNKWQSRNKLKVKTEVMLVGKAEVLKDIPIVTFNRAKMVKMLYYIQHSW